MQEITISAYLANELPTDKAKTEAYYYGLEHFFDYDTDYYFDLIIETFEKYGFSVNKNNVKDFCFSANLYETYFKIDDIIKTVYNKEINLYCNGRECELYYSDFINGEKTISNAIHWANVAYKEAKEAIATCIEYDQSEAQIIETLDANGVMFNKYGERIKV